MASLTPEQTAEYKEGFKLFDKKNQNTIPKEDLGTVMRALGLNPTNAELATYMKSGADEHSLTLDEFLAAMQTQNGKEDSPVEIKEAFKIFDRNDSGQVSAQELRHVLTTIGEKLSEQEFEEMWKEVKDTDIEKNGLIDCAAFVTMLTTR